MTKDSFSVSNKDTERFYEMMGKNEVKPNSTKPIRVLQVIGIMNRGGAENMIMNLYRRMDKTQIQFDFLVQSREPGQFDQEIKAMGGRIFSISKFKGMNPISYYRECVSFFKAHPEILVVHGHIGSSAALYLKAANAADCYTIAHSHSAGGIRNLHDFLYSIFSFPTRYTANQLLGCSTEAGRARFGKKAITKPNYKNFNNAVDLKLFYFNQEERDKIRKEFSVEEDDLLIGSVGRITRPKNPEGLYEMFQEIVASDKKVKCLWVGTGELEEQFRNRIKKDKLEDRIIMTGVRSDIPHVLQGLDCFLFPSLWEGAPVSVVEAQAAGLPCVLADTISREIEITPLIEWHSLEEDVSVWAGRCLELARQYKGKRTFFQDGVRDSGYDIEDTTKWLSEFYREAAGVKGRRRDE